MRVGEGLAQSQIAARVRISQVHVSRLLTAALHKLGQRPSAESVRM
jgi:DNA-directed RNA polymerase specialized sigma subunit